MEFTAEEMSQLKARNKFLEKTLLECDDEKISKLTKRNKFLEKKLKCYELAIKITQK